MRKRRVRVWVTITSVQESSCLVSPEQYAALKAQNGDSEARRAALGFVMAQAKPHEAPLDYQQTDVTARNGEEELASWD